MKGQVIKNVFSCFGCMFSTKTTDSLKLYARKIICFKTLIFPSPELAYVKISLVQNELQTRLNGLWAFCIIIKFLFMTSNI